MQGLGALYLDVDAVQTDNVASFLAAIAVLNTSAHFDAK
jgi:hypothetical protein